MRAGRSCPSTPRHVEELLIVNLDKRTVDWLALDGQGEHHPVQRSGLVDLGPGELATRIDWP